MSLIQNANGIPERQIAVVSMEKVPLIDKFDGNSFHRK